MKRLLKGKLIEIRTNAWTGEEKKVEIEYEIVGPEVLLWCKDLE